MQNIQPDESIKRSIDAYVLEKGSMYESIVRPMLDELAIRIIVGLDADGWEIRPTDKLK